MWAYCLTPARRQSHYTPLNTPGLATDQHSHITVLLPHMTAYDCMIDRVTDMWQLPLLRCCASNVYAAHAEYAAEPIY